jgi:uncharacterized protein YbjT (DUF2867 family)
MNVLVLGAAGQLGRAVTLELSRAGHQVRAFVRREPDPPFPGQMDVNIGDAADPAAVRDAASAQDAVVNTIGAGTLRRSHVESTTTGSVIGALDGFRGRYVAVSAGLVGANFFLFDHVIRPLFLRNIDREKRALEQLVRSSQIDWTIVRPARLTNNAPRGYLESETERPGDRLSVSRQDVAAFIAHVVGRPEYGGKIVFVGSR